MADDLSSLKDDMTAFILGHGMSRFQGYVTEDVHSVMWDPTDNPESWKDFVELAKKAGCAFLSMDEEVLQRDELDYLVQRLQHASYPSDEDLEEARWLRSYIGKTGFIQLGWPHQGIMFLFEVSHRVVRALSAPARPGGRLRQPRHRRHRPGRRTLTCAGSFAMPILHRRRTPRPARPACLCRSSPTLLAARGIRHRREAQKFLNPSL